MRCAVLAIVLLAAAGPACDDEPRSAIGRPCQSEAECDPGAPHCIPFDRARSVISESGEKMCTRTCGGTTRCAEGYGCIQHEWHPLHPLPPGLELELGAVELCTPFSE